MDINIKVKGQLLQFIDGDPEIASGTTNFVRFVFDFSEDWEGLEVAARWTNGGVIYEADMEEGNCVYLPAGISPGLCKMTLHGTDDNGRVGTTLPIKMDIIDSGYNI